MRDHSMIGSDAASLNRPGPQQRFKCFDHAEDRRSLEGLHRLYDLRDCGNKAQIHATRPKHLCGMRYDLPRLGKIEDETIERQAIVEQTNPLEMFRQSGMRFGMGPMYRSIFIIAVRAKSSRAS